VGLALVLAVILWGVAVRTAAAQQPTPSDDEVNAIARQLYCPVCENTPLDVCPTQACHDWRELIRQMLAEGKTPDQIKQYFVDHYGARVLAASPETGINWIVYVASFVLLGVGVFFLLRAFQIWRKTDRPAPAVDPADGSGNADYLVRLEEELKKRK
jgi:cytochrome c-type biogenesis protein CcmH